MKAKSPHLIFDGKKDDDMDFDIGRGGDVDVILGI